MASVEKLPSGKFSGVYRDAAGKKKRVKGTFDRKTDAREAAQEAEVRARRQAAARVGTLSARTAWGAWWEIFSADRTFDSDTGRTEADILKNYLLPQWGDVPLNQLSHRSIQDWVDEIKQGKSPSYVQRIYAVFRVSITAALTRGVLAASPCAGVRLPKRRKRPKPYLDAPDAQSMGERQHEVYRDAVAFSLETGLRPGELAGLHAHRVDFRTGWMEVAETYVFKKRVMRPFPKDKDARRVPLTEKAMEIARRRLSDRELNEGCGVPHTDGMSCTNSLVFITPYAKRVMSRDSLYLSMRKAADAAGLPRRSPYATRRGFATRAAEGGMDAFQLADVLGHETLAQSQEYVQQTPAARAKMLAALGERPALAAVEDVGQHGTGRGTDLSRQVTPESSTDRGEDTG